MFDPMESGILGPPEGSIKHVNNNGVIEFYIRDSGEWVQVDTDELVEGIVEKFGMGSTDKYGTDKLVQEEGLSSQTECSHADARVVYSACGVDLIACECGYEGKR